METYSDRKQVSAGGGAWGISKENEEAFRGDGHVDILIVVMVSEM